MKEQVWLPACLVQFTSTRPMSPGQGAAVFVELLCASLWSFQSSATAICLSSSASTDPTISCQNIRAFAASGPTFWNSLADELRTDSSDRFKLALKTFLFATYYRIQRIRGFCSDALYKLMIDSDVCLYVLPVNVVLFCKLCKPWYWCWAEGEITCCRRQSHALHNSFLTVAHCHGWSA